MRRAESPQLGKLVIIKNIAVILLILSFIRENIIYRMIPKITSKPSRTTMIWIVGIIHIVFLRDIKTALTVY